MANNKTFIIKNVFINQQGVGAYISKYFEADGTPKPNKNKKDIKAITGLVDIGSRTIEAIKISKNKLQDDESQTFDNIGIFYVYKNTVNEINDKFDADYRAEEIEDIIRSNHGKLKLRKEIIDINSIYEKHCNELAEIIANKLKILWTDLEKFDFIELTSGGGSSLYEYLNEIMKEVEINLMENPQEANVIGYLAIANVKLKEKEKEVAKIKTI